MWWREPNKPDGSKEHAVSAKRSPLSSSSSFFLGLSNINVLPGARRNSERTSHYFRPLYSSPGPGAGERWVQGMGEVKSVRKVKEKGRRRRRESVDTTKLNVNRSPLALLRSSRSAGSPEIGKWRKKKLVSWKVCFTFLFLPTLLHTYALLSLSLSLSFSLSLFLFLSLITLSPCRYCYSRPERKESTLIVLKNKQRKIFFVLGAPIWSESFPLRLSLLPLLHRFLPS